MNAELLKELKLKLHPTRLSVSGKFSAILACMLGETWTEPSIVELCVTSDGVLMARRQGHLGFDHVEGHVADLMRNIEGVAKAAGLSDEAARMLVELAPRVGINAPRTAVA